MMTSTTKRRFTDEFKREAVALWETSGRMQTEVAAELGIMPTMLRRWQRKLQDSNDMLVSRSEEHTSELQSLMRISYAVFFLKKQNTYTIKTLILDSTTSSNLRKSTVL